MYVQVSMYIHCMFVCMYICVYISEVCMHIYL